MAQQTPEYPRVGWFEMRKLNQLRKMYPHICFFCFYFQFREGEKPRNRNCRIGVVTHERPGFPNECAEWKIDPVPEHRVRRIA